ncbi:MAG: YIP1 family protein [Acidobacteriota bacterium]|nr:YIP1 family protein [Acidobacteriota bacterium]
MATFTQRMLGAAKLDVNTYEEVEADTSAMGQAMALVVLANLAAGVGSLGEVGIVGALIASILALVGWFMWAGLTYLIGTKILPEPQTESDVGELLRTIGFASSPGLLRVFGFLPVVGTILNFVVGVWMLMAMVVAVRQALDYKGTGRAIGVCLIGWLVYFLVGIFAAVILTGLGLVPAE